MTFQCLRYLIPQRLTPGALTAARTCFANAAGTPEASIRITLAKLAGTAWQMTDAELREFTTAAHRHVLQMSSPDAQEWNVSLEFWSNRWTLCVEAPAEDAAVELRDAVCEALGTKRARAYALALSGGGFRATLFHLGVIRMLAAAGQLANVTHVCSVSGGSIVAAHLVLNWARYLGGDLDRATAEVVRFAQRDVRGRVFRRWLLGGLLAPFLMLLGRRERWSRTQLLQAEYARLYGHRRLEDLGSKGDPDATPPRPTLFMLATAMKTGDMCSFTDGALQFERRYFGVRQQERPKTIVCKRVPIALAVSASSAFPPAFPPIRVCARSLSVPEHEMSPSEEYLSDGGVYDNLGIRKSRRLRDDARIDIDGILLSDAEAPFTWQVGRDFGRIWQRAVRASDILMRRVAQLEIEGADSEKSKGERPLYHIPMSFIPRAERGDMLHQAVISKVAEIRTDLDRFHDVEVRLLIEHGFKVARMVFAEQIADGPEQRNRLLQLAGSRLAFTAKDCSPTSGDSALASSEPNDPAVPGGNADSPETVEQLLSELSRIQQCITRWTSAVFDSRDWATWASGAVALTYGVCLAAVIALGINWRIARETTDLKSKTVAANDARDQAVQEREKIKGVYAPLKDAYNETWSFQVSYLDSDEIAKSLSIRDRLQWNSIMRTPRTAPRPSASEDFNNLHTVVGRQSEVFEAQVLWRRRLSMEDAQGLIRGRVMDFVFPNAKTETKILLEFEGDLTGAEIPEEIPIQFTQSRSLDPQSEFPMRRYRVVFQRVGEGKHYQGQLLHDRLKDKDEKPLAIATFHLRKDSP